MAVLKRLRELTESLPPLASADFRVDAKGGVDYDVERGGCHAVPLMYASQVAVQYCKMDANTLFPFHSHQEIEVLVIIRGAAEKVTGEGNIPLGSGSTITNRPGEVHGLRAISEVELIGITIPSSDGYPRMVNHEPGV